MPKKKKEEINLSIESNEAENEVKKRPRGRPRKEPSNKGINNEDKKVISMSQDENIYTLDNLNARWKSIFSNNPNRTYTEVMGAYQSAWNQLNNPFIQNQRVKQINAQARKESKENLQKALEDPQNNELALQQVSFGLYYVNYFYNQLIKLDRNTPLYNWYALPQYVSDEDYKTEAFKKESIKVDRIMKAFKPSLTFKTIATQVAIEGKSAYLPRYSIKSDGTVDFFLLQKLNTNQVKITGFGSEQQFICSYNFITFMYPGYSIEQYPPFFKKIWNEMQTSGLIFEDSDKQLKVNPKSGILPGNGTLEWNEHVWAYWVQLPQDLAYVFYTDGSHPNQLPDAIGMFQDYNELDDYKYLQQSLMSNGVTSVLTAEIPFTKDAKALQDSTLPSVDTVLGHLDYFNQNVSANIFPFAAPFQNFALHSLPNQPESLDIVYDRTRDLLASTGNSALISTDAKPSIASVVTARKLQAAKADYLTRQFEEFLNNMLEREFDLRYNWRVNLWGDIFDRLDDIKNLKELINNGYEGLIPKLLSACNHSLEDYRGAKLYIDALDVKPYKSFEVEKMKLQADLNIKVNKAGIEVKESVDVDESITGEEKKRGRPILEDNDITSEATEVARNNGQDTEQKDASHYS